MAFVWFNLFILLFYILRKKLGILLGYQYLPLMIVVILSLFRLFVPLETPYTTVLRSYHILPRIQEILQISVIQCGLVCITLGILVVCIFSLVSFFLLIRLLRMIQKECKAINCLPRIVDKRLIHLFQTVKEESPVGRACDVVVSRNYTEPFIFSFRRSIIVIPDCMLNLSDQDLYFVLKHEWQHHLDWDNQVKIGIEVLCCILWWNPFVYLLRRNVSQTLELKCDRKVTKHLVESDKLDYMDSLLRVMRLTCKNANAAMHCKVIASIYYLGVSVSRQDCIDQDTIQRFEVTMIAENEKKTTGIICVIALGVLFFLSFGFVIQPASFPPLEDLYSETDGVAEIQMISVTPENAYLLENADGTYSLYIDGNFFRRIKSEEVKYELYKELLIKNIKK